MTSSNATPPKKLAHEHKWRMFIEFTLSDEPYTVHLATDLVVGTVQTLNWPAAHLEQLRLALTEAIQNVLERSHQNNSDASIIIRVFVPEDGETMPEINLPGDELKQQQQSTEAVQQVRPSPARGWGFFLVQKQGIVRPVLTTRPHHLIELFLYQESHDLSRR